MAAPKALTIESEVVKSLDAWIGAAASYLDERSFLFKSFMNALEKLAQADALAASIHKAYAVHFTGNLEGSLYWIENAKKLSRDQTDATRLSAVVHSNLGYFSQAVAPLRALTEPERVRSVNMLFLTACYPELIALRDAQHASDQSREIAGHAERCQMTLERLSIRPEVVRQVLDLAGEVLRRHRMFFAGQLPIVHTADDCFLYELQIDVEPEAATRMTDEVIAMMVEQDLDAPGLAFSFVGTRH